MPGGPSSASFGMGWWHQSLSFSGDKVLVLAYYFGKEVLHKVFHLALSSFHLPIYLTNQC
jgi:hypothetical protein